YPSHYTHFDYTTCLTLLLRVDKLSNPSSHECPVEHGLLPVRLPRHEQVPGAGSGLRDREFFSWTHKDQLGRSRWAQVRPEGALALEHVGEPLELGRHRCRDRPALGQFDVEDQGGRPQMDGGALADQDPNDRVALPPRRDLLR